MNRSIRALQFLVFSSVLFISCNEEENKKIEADIVNVEEVEVDEVEFGIRVNDYKVVRDKVKRNETLGIILQEYNVGNSKINEIASVSKELFDIRKIQLHKPYSIICQKDSLNTADYFIYQPNKIEYIVVDLRDSLNIYQGKKEVKLVEREVSGVIEENLSMALDQQGIDYRVSNSLNDIYAWTVDFFRINKGDYFRVIFDEKYIDDTTYVGIGQIKAAEFNASGESFYAFPYEENGNREFFDEDGRNLRKAFLKAPLKFGTFRISSRYSGRRFHPVQHRWKAHLGTDYAAPTGTPIYATAAGTVVESRYKSNNGHFVKIKHNSTYTTQYLHMSKRLVRVGQKVRQGQLIGKVGSTGLASGPHVCYRFWRNGVQVDALRQKLPDVKPMNDSLKVHYLKDIEQIKHRLSNINLPVKFEVEEINLEEDVLSST